MSKEWMSVKESAYSHSFSAVDQRIRAWAKRDELIAMRRRGLWYFAHNNVLVSAEAGMNDEEAISFLKGGE
jgi:hypothetical protein